MAICAVWLDSEHAKFFEIDAGKVNHQTIKNKHHDHRTDSKAEHAHASDPLFKELTVKMGHAERILIIGPGLAKDHFKSYLEKHHHGGLAKKIIGMQTVDHMTDNQVLAWVREYFKHDIHE